MRRFYPTRYYPKKFRDSMKEADHWDYTKAQIVRFERGWGRMAIIGYYADYIKYVNMRKPKRESDHSRKSRHYR